MNALDLDTRPMPSGSWGNKQTEEFKFTLANGDNIGSTHDVVIVPAGVRPLDANLLITNASNATVTANIGFVAIPGESAAQDDNDWLFALQALSALAFVRRTSQAAPFTLAQKMFLRLTVAGANITEATEATLFLDYRYLGNP